MHLSIIPSTTPPLCYTGELTGEFPPRVGEIDMGYQHSIVLLYQIPYQSPIDSWRQICVLMSDNAPGERFLTWYSVKSPLFPHPTRGGGGVGDATDSCIFSKQFEFLTFSYVYYGIIILATLQKWMSEPHPKIGVK